MAVASRIGAFDVGNDQMIMKIDPRDCKRLFYVTGDRNMRVMVSNRHLDDYAQ